MAPQGSTVGASVARRRRSRSRGSRASGSSGAKERNIYKTPRPRRAREKKKPAPQSRTDDPLNPKVLRRCCAKVYAAVYNFFTFLVILVVGRETFDLSSVKNEFELVIKASKELEFLLAKLIGTEPDGPARNEKLPTGLHGKLNMVPPAKLRARLVRDVRWIATMRNKLVHEYDFNELTDGERTMVREKYESSRKYLVDLVEKRLSAIDQGNADGVSTCNIC